jgi:hypothetical protein
MIRFHVPGVAYTRTTKDYSCCAFTQKLRRLCKMFTEHGCEVIHYGTEGSDPICTENVVVQSDTEFMAGYGSEDFTTKQYRVNQNQPQDEHFLARCADEINRRKRPSDILICGVGGYHKPVADRVNLFRTVEPGIGYQATFAPFRIWESYAWMHFCYGRQQTGCGQGLKYDTVIPPAFDPSEFTLQTDKGDYLLFVARMNVDKGVQLAIDVARATKRKLILAGQGKLEWYNTKDADVEHVGVIGPERKNELMGGARALIAPTHYIEPCGYVAIEAQFCGTPAITSDWGGFTETVLDGSTGFRCHTLRDFCLAVEKAETIKPETCRRWVEAKNGIETTWPLYQTYFQRLDQYEKSMVMQATDEEAKSMADRYGTHVRLLAAAVKAYPGPVLELGCGNHSTPMLHRMCSGRRLVTIDDNADWFGKFKGMASADHSFLLLKNYDEADSLIRGTQWGVVLVDHRTDRRIVEMAKVTNAGCVIAHDTESTQYGYHNIEGLFAYKVEDRSGPTWTTAYSNAPLLISEPSRT